MKIIKEINELKEFINSLGNGRSLALVPTMGAIHAGHQALVRCAQARADAVIASVFVNPLQFNDKGDLSNYPRDLVGDSKKLNEVGCDAIWAPDLPTMYPQGFSTTVKVGSAARGFEGPSRPGHFDGVVTVVTKLFNQIQPDVAVFGEKDWQQLAVVRQLVRDLDIPVDIIGAPIERDAHGLALSSRNALLSPKGLEIARRLNAVLRAGGGEADLLAAGFETVDYIDTRGGRILAAAWVEGVRLIDNMPIK